MVDFSFTLAASDGNLFELAIVLVLIALALGGRLVKWLAERAGKEPEEYAEEGAEAPPRPSRPARPPQPERVERQVRPTAKPQADLTVPGGRRARAAVALSAQAERAAGLAGRELAAEPLAGPPPRRPQGQAVEAPKPPAPIRLDDRDALRLAIIYHEVFSPPKALRTEQETWLGG